MTPQLRAVIYAFAAAVFAALPGIDAHVWLPVVDGVLGLLTAILAVKHSASSIRSAIYVLAGALFVALNAVGVSLDAGMWLPVVDTALGLGTSLLALVHVQQPASPAT